MLAFYHGANVDISQMFYDPVWLTLNCELPAMTHQTSSEQAKGALQRAEKRSSEYVTRGYLLCAYLYTVSVTMKYKSERTRIIDFVPKLKEKGFSLPIGFYLRLKKRGLLVGSRLPACISVYNNCQAYQPDRVSPPDA
ncbi:hypothetical protein BDV23DRAFT_184425 [Aspergillus alliaceus]|uniref:Uncharacterized protein n=1 Tax=Petromyces alliaceus TaxID=209559 RepID=A0A5N7C5X7_PETAA|nr:hypothetical protein BDV23DRAFT_184425 [Aspergillus alliaceus]